MINSGRLFALIGASRSGKTQKALKELERHKFALIWDVEEQYKATIRAKTPAELKAVLVRYKNALPRRKETIAYTGKLSDFGVFCQLGFWWVRRMFLYGENSAMVFEETADVTSPSKAPENYGILLRRGLKYGVDLFCITQRPAESDKTSIGNASVVHVCRLQLPRDRKTVAELSGVPLVEIEALRADQEKGVFDYISVDTGRGFYTGGQLTFPRKSAKFTQTHPEKPI